MDKKKKQMQEEPAEGREEVVAQEEQPRPTPAPAPEVVTLEQRLAMAEAAAEDYKRKWYAVSAEYDNFRKRTALVRSQSYAEGRAEVVAKLFPIADNLERAIQSCADDNTRRGIGMVMGSFERLLAEEKIEIINPVGEEFNANKCEAIMAVEGDKGDVSGTVKQVFLKGYEQNGKVLRFAQVSVVK